MSRDDKLNCRLICKRINEIISGTSCHGLNVFFPSQVEQIPKLRSNHEKVLIQNLICKSLKHEIRQILEHLSHNLIHLKLSSCVFDSMTLYKFLSVLPLLELVELDIRLIMKTSIELTNDDLTKLLNCQELKMKLNYNMGIVLHLEIDSHAFGAFNIKKTKHLNLMQYIVKETYMFHHHITFDLNSNGNTTPIDDTTADYLNELNGLHLFYVDNEMNKVFQTKIIDGLTGLVVNYTAEEKNMFFQEIHRQLEMERRESERIKTTRTTREN